MGLSPSSIASTPPGPSGCVDVEFHPESRWVVWEHAIALLEIGARLVRIEPGDEVFVTPIAGELVAIGYRKPGEL
jgi:hypothetical protein